MKMVSKIWKKQKQNKTTATKKKKKPRCYYVTRSDTDPAGIYNEPKSSSGDLSPHILEVLRS